jgi:hypothetical protein
MKVIEFNKSEKADAEHATKELEKWVEHYKSSDTAAYLAFFVKINKDRAYSIEHLNAFYKNHGCLLLGALEIIKKEIIKVMEG